MGVILSSSERKGDARERLLAWLLAAFGESLPSPEMSLREVAARAETSHALLRYHFGSLSGVLAAMLKAQRSRDNEALLEAAQQGTFDDFVVADDRLGDLRVNVFEVAAEGVALGLNVGVYAGNIGLSHLFPLLAWAL